MELKTMKHCGRVDLWPGAFAWKDILFARDWRQQNSCFHGFPRPMKRKVFICLIEFFFLDKEENKKRKGQVDEIGERCTSSITIWFFLFLC